MSEEIKVEMEFDGKKLIPTILEKEYSVPDDLAKIMSDSVAYENLRDTYARLPFGFKRGVKCSIIAVKLTGEFWRGIYDLYPKLKGKNIGYSVDTKILTEKNHE